MPQTNPPPYDPHAPINPNMGGGFNAFGTALGAIGTAIASNTALPTSQRLAAGGIIAAVGSTFSSMSGAFNQEAGPQPGQPGYQPITQEQIDIWAHTAANLILESAIALNVPLETFALVSTEFATLAAETFIGTLLGPEIAIALGAALFMGLAYWGASTLGGELLDATSWLGDLFGFSFGAVDPIVLDLDGNGVSLTWLDASGVHFDLNQDGFAEHTGWLSGGDGLLVRDLNANGIVDNGSELIGNVAQDGFSILATFDGNADGVIDASDAIFSELRVWRDANQDGVTQTGELGTLASLGVVSITLASTPEGWWVQREGNTILRTGSFTSITGTHEALAVAFGTDQVNTQFELPEGFTFDPDVFLLPNLRGYGSVPDLWVAMSLDPTLKQMVQDLVADAADFTSIDDLVGQLVIGFTAVGQPPYFGYDMQAFDHMLARWADVDTGDEERVQAENIAETFMNQQADHAFNNPYFYDAFETFATNLAVRFYVQVPRSSSVALMMEFAHAIQDAVPADGVALTPEEIDTIGAPFVSAFENSDAVDPDLEPYAHLRFDFANDSITGDIAGFIDHSLESYDFDPSEPWVGYDDWHSDHRRILEVVDQDGTHLEDRHRAYTVNVDLDILRLPHDTVTGTAGIDTLTGDGDGIATPDLVIGGAGDDSLNGGAGDDTYLFASGSGADVVSDASGADEIAFQGSLLRSIVHFSFANNGYEDLLISFEGRSETVEVTGYFAENGAATIETLSFPDGTIFDERMVRDAVLANLSTSDSDTIVAFSLASTLVGLAGDDTLIGRHGNDLIVGGEGDDVLTGSGGDDTYLFMAGDGDDLVQEAGSVWDGMGGTDTISLPDGVVPSDVTVTETDNGHNLLLTFAGSTDSIAIVGAVNDGNQRVERILFANGTVWTHFDLMAMALAPTAGNDHFYGGYDVETIQGAAGDDIIDARNGADTLIGGAGNDLLSGSGGDDIYVFNRGDGQDVVRDYVDDWSGRGGFETVEFGEDIDPADVIVTQADNGNDLVLTIAGTTDSITLDGTVNDGWQRIEQVRFGDGTVWTHASLLARATTPTAAADTFFGGYDAETLWGGAGDDVIDARAGNDLLIGGTGNDLLTGSGGDDIYLFARGDGEDTISEFVSVWSGNSGFDTIDFAEGIAPADVTVTQAENGDDIVITINNGGGSVTLDHDINDGWYRIERVRFADGTIWSHADLITMATAPTAGNDTFWGSYDGETIEGGAGDDVIDARAGNDVLVGGAGDDILSGSGGDDTYIFNLGDGQDIVRDEVDVWSGHGGFDIISFGAGITAADVTVVQADGGRDVVLSIAGTADKITIDDALTNGWNAIEEVHFADGTSWTKDELLARSMGATSGPDTIFGDGSANTLDGLAGDDILEGGDGSDSYVFGIGSGRDTIVETMTNINLGEDDTILFGAGVHWSDLGFELDGDTLIITIAGTSDSLTLTGQFTTITDTSTATWWDVENFVFADGTAKTTADVIAAMIAGTSGDDHLVGVYTNDVFTGGLGDDLLEGQRGNDTYVFNLGDGHDTIRDYVNYWGSYDRLELGAGIAPSDLRFSRAAGDENDMVLSFASGAGSITLDNQFYSGTEWGVDEIAFANGTVWTKAQIQAAFDAATSNNSAPELVAGSSDVDAAFAEIEDETGEATVHDADGLIVFADAEAFDAHTAEIVSVDVDGAVGGLPSTATLLSWLSLGSLDDQEGGASGSVAWSFAAADSAFDYLAEGESATLTYVVAVSDGYGGTLEQEVSVEIAGRNDAPTGLDIAAAQTLTVPMTVDGHALLVSPNVYQLTPDGGYAYGAIWGEIDLSSDTVWTTKVFFGGNDYWGADGLAFAIGAGPSFNNTTAYALGVLASGNIGIKFDNYANGEMGDPGDDFSQFVLNGNVSTTSTAFDARHTHANLENNAWHDLVIAWNAATHTLSYSLDGAVIASKVYDISDLLLDGGSEAWFGFGAATGGLTNYQSVEIVSITQATGDLGVNENAAAGTLVGHLAGHDPDTAGSLSYAIVDAEGDAVTDSMFVLDGDALKVKTGAVIDYETATSHSLYIKVSDGEGGSRIETLTVAINDVVDSNEAPDGLRLVTRADVDSLALVGSGANLGDGEYRLTQQWSWQSGGVWGAVDLANDVTWTTRMFFGWDDYWGADGMAFALQNSGTSATGGFGVLSSTSFGIRFDTYYNGGEPGGDFTQFVRNNDGAQSFDPYHQHANLEDNAWHDVVIHWDAANYTLSYSIDGVAIASKAYDVATDLFGGSTEAWYGFGGATGGLANYQAVEILSVDSEITHYDVSETIADGALVAYLDGSDPNDDALTYTIVDALGDAVSDTIFEIDNGDELRIKDGALLDADTEPTHDLYVQVSDGSGLTYLAHLVFEVI